MLSLPNALPLSATAIARRIRALEERGVIQRSPAEHRPAGARPHHDGHRSRRPRQLRTKICCKSFEEAVATAPSVVACRLMSGEDARHLSDATARDLADFERIHKEQLSRLPGVARLKSSFVSHVRDKARCQKLETLLPSRKCKTHLHDHFAKSANFTTLERVNPAIRCPREALSNF